MKIWQLSFELDDYDNLVPIKEFTVEEIQSFDGRSHLRQWKPVQVKRMEPFLRLHSFNLNRLKEWSLRKGLS